jgi:hypothetical protein
MKKKLIIGSGHSTFLATIFDILPVFLPFFSPTEGSGAYWANLDR